MQYHDEKRYYSLNDKYDIQECSINASIVCILYYCSYNMFLHGIVKYYYFAFLSPLYGLVL